MQISLSQKSQKHTEVSVLLVCWLSSFHKQAWYTIPFVNQSSHILKTIWFFPLFLQEDSEYTTFPSKTSEESCCFDH